MDNSKRWKTETLTDPKPSPLTGLFPDLASHKFRASAIIWRRALLMILAFLDQQTKDEDSTIRAYFAAQRALVVSIVSELETQYNIGSKRTDNERDYHKPPKGDSRFTK